MNSPIPIIYITLLLLHNLILTFPNPLTEIHLTAPDHKAIIAKADQITLSNNLFTLISNVRLGGDGWLLTCDFAIIEANPKGTMVALRFARSVHLTGPNFYLEAGQAASEEALTLLLSRNPKAWFKQSILEGTTIRINITSMTIQAVEGSLETSQ